jgi:sugar phosphate isomerase/epimerase
MAMFLAMPAAARAGQEIFQRSNLVAWCIVPFDSQKRGPEERAAMLQRLGLRRFAYDYRKEHIPTFDAELEALKRHGIELTAWWFPSQFNDEAKATIELFKRHGVHPQLWVTGSAAAPSSPAQVRDRIESEAARIAPIARAAAAIGCKVALYNHGGWFGEPENQIAIIQRLRSEGVDNVGIVYNLHHGHAHVDRMADLLALMKPHLLALNLNGMMRHGDQKNMKILPIGQGDLDEALLRVIADSGWIGPVGILNHTAEDAELRLLDNLDGLSWLTSRLSGDASTNRPTPRTWNPPASP